MGGKQRIQDDYISINGGVPVEKSYRVGGKGLGGRARHEADGGARGHSGSGFEP